MVFEFNSSSDLSLAEAENQLPSIISQMSPRRPPSYRLNDRKEKRQPSITPRKFTRFFTPRSHGPHSTSSSREVLDDITAPANNCNGTQSSPLQPFSYVTGHENSPTAFTRDMKRRKLLHTPSPSPDESSSEKSLQFSQPRISHEATLGEESNTHASPYPATAVGRSGGYRKQELAAVRAAPRRVKQLDARGLAGQLVQLSIGHSGTSKLMHPVRPVADWQAHTAEFYSRPEDTHFCTSVESSARSIPFCVGSCNTNSLIAIGDEEGQVRLLESAKDSKHKFKDIFLAFRPHSNAIIDMCFSLDDSLLATASGDQTARVVDMTTQRTISVLAQHSASLKQVRFQPGVANNSVIATSSRDGSVQIWDLRCKGTDGPVQSIHIPIDPANVIAATSRANEITYGCVVNSICGAHRPGLHGRQLQPAVPRDGPSRGETPGRIGDVSVTAIAFLPRGQEHMLLTASEANASVKLWDVRSLHNTRRKTALPLSCTAQPQSHSQWRHFGINSLNLSGNGSRLYTLCKDNTVYAYSTAHLILGQAPEPSTTTIPRRRQPVDIQEGLGPLYGFRHRQLHATSFYVKSAIRTAKSGKVEMLAVGSCDGCTILFPTDERYLEAQQKASDSDPINDRLRLRRSGSSLVNSSRFDESIPISQNGTPLIRGHDREVGALTWTSDGELVTVGDDFLVRCWREGGDARKLRMGGEQGGQRWGCGWANVPTSYDEDEDEDV